MASCTALPAALALGMGVLVASCCCGSLCRTSSWGCELPPNKSPKRSVARRNHSMSLLGVFFQTRGPIRPGWSTAARASGAEEATRARLCAQCCCCS
ncbi:hypothetical protein V8C86DRAFT_2812820, partial [Haematococcus lacustris]